MGYSSIAVATLVAVCLTGACGGGDDGPSRAEFIAKGDAICAQANAKREPIEDATVAAAFGSGRAPTLTEFRTFFERTAPIDAQEFAGLKALEPPEDDQARFSRWMVIQDKVKAKLAGVRRAATSGDQTAFDAALGELERTAEPLEAELRDYGFKVCGSSQEG